MPPSTGRPPSGESGDGTPSTAPATAICGGSGTGPAAATTSNRPSSGPRSGPRSLREHLSEQIGVDLRDPVDRMIAAHLLDHLDEAGYLRLDLDTAARELGCATAQVERVLARVQEFDPPGVFARDLAECLALQLRDRNRLDPAMQRLLEHLPLLAARNAAALMQVCQVDAEDLAEMIAEIRSLDPRPGHSFDAPPPQPVIPDILMRAAAAGRLDCRAEPRDDAAGSRQQPLLRPGQRAASAARPSANI